MKKIGGALYGSDVSYSQGVRYCLLTLRSGYRRVTKPPDPDPILTHLISIVNQKGDKHV
jgi:hypothetical protein